MENIFEGKWMYNTQEGDEWGIGDFYDTPKEAEEAALKDLDQDCDIFIGQCETVPLPKSPDVGQILDWLDDMYADLSAGFYDGESLFDNVSRASRKWLETELEKILTEFYNRTGIKSYVYTITNIYQFRTGYEE